MLVLAFDTATPAVTAALHDGERVLAESTTIDARRHGELLVPTIEAVLAEAGVALGDLTAIVAGMGPGPYTGLRVGLMTAQALSTAVGVPAHGICTLDAVAYGSGLSSEFLVATDARRKEVFWARYADMRTRLEGPFVDRPADLAARLAPADSPADPASDPASDPAADAAVGLAGGDSVVRLAVAGQGGVIYPAIFGNAVAPPYPYAGFMAALAAERIAAGEQLDPARPIYLRRPDAVMPGAPKKVTA